jgi:peptidoglycan/LPS O-acetylase OafA/YrhL
MTAGAPKAVSFTNSQASVLLDLLRALAAFLVLLSHWKIMFFVDYPQIPAHKWLFAAPYVLGSAGHQSVLIFFVLSGYLISGSVFRALDGGFWSWRSYLTHRFVRLYVVLVPGLLLCAACDWVGLHYAHVPDLYNGVSPKTHLIDVGHTLTLPVFFGNLAFVQTVFVPVFGSDGALWSLANEFWYYMLFPLGLLALRKETAIPRRIAFGALFLVIAWFTRSEILPLFPVWLAGTLLALLPPPRVGRSVRIAASGAYALAIFLFSKGQFLPGLAHDYVFGAISFFYIRVLLSAREASGNSRHVHWIRQAARFSFSLYVIHMPLLLLITAFVAGDRLFSPTRPGTDAVALLALASLMAAAYGFGWLTEFRTDKVRRWVELRLDRPPRQLL